MEGLSIAPREVALEAGGYVKGVAVAVVTQNKDDEGLGRVKVRYPWYENPNESYWARIAVPMAGADQGTYFLPEKEQEVLVAFEREDIRFPFVIGALWNGKDATPLNNSDGKNDLRVIRSRDKHEILFNDGADSALHLKLRSGQILELTNEQMRWDDGQGNSITVKSGAIDVKALSKVTISAPTITLDASGTMEVKAGATMTIRGTLVQIN
ncbi:uncharacterized protein involved in type VI secretion and phage assembly [Bradyrhizobium sp. AZCC 1588]|uniref:phage baseplate assembly protein V n=1 Tax=unclassified Bradyrhizobium TaxID=2631580 RepID=UPI002FF35B26